MEYISYLDCPVYSELKRKTEPLVSQVKIDEFTDMAQKNFDYEFTGKVEFYPFEKPELPKEFKICCIVGASGSGKSTLLKEFSDYELPSIMFDGNAIISNFHEPEDAVQRLSSVGLNSIPTWCKPREVLSTGEGFRADLAVNLESYTLFDEFTSTIDRNVAKSTCNGIKKFIDKTGITNVVFCSCHKDFIPFLKPDFVVDTDYEKVYDCRGQNLGETSPCKSTKLMQEICGECLASITI